jgi:serine/threonine protein phosphatase PrpC
MRAHALFIIVLVCVVQDFAKLIQTSSESHHQDEMLETITNSFRNAFHSTDAALIERCREHDHHYTASTGVTAFFFQNLLSVAHVGDSRACIARVSGDGGGIECEMLTMSHKANQPHELQRIESQGGSLVYLHGDKPYIR